MKILQITAFSGFGCTGRIAVGIHRKAEKHGHKGAIAWGRINTAPGDVTTIRIGTPTDYRLHGLYARLTDRCGFGSKRATARFIRELEELGPDLVQLHILHGYYVNLELLFTALKEMNIPVVWTFHDCWAITGHCPYFSFAECEKYRSGCGGCALKHHHPESWFVDNSRRNWEDKRRLFTELEKLVIVCPSRWLAGLVQDGSFLRDKTVRVIPNGINTGIFHPVKNNIKEELGLAGRHIVLGVSSTWSSTKGLPDFIELSKRLPEDCKVVLVGLTPAQMKTLPENILGIPRTDSPETLAKLYSAASVFVNPTYEDNYPTTNLEALACGTPVVTYDTGGSPEAVTKSGFGAVTPVGDIARLGDAAARLISSPPQKANSSLVLDEEELYEQYISLYEELTSSAKAPAL